MKILDIGKKKLKRLSLKVRRSKLAMVLYTLLVLLIGIVIGGHYEGQHKDGTYYYHIMDLTFYGGVYSNDQN